MDFTALRTWSAMFLSRSARKIRDVPNAGGNSVCSEVLSYEMLHRCFGAQLTKTEMDVSYFPTGGSITDYVCTMFGKTLAVSVTRAMKYMGEFQHEDAEKLLNKKLAGVIQSSSNSVDKWHKQILHIWATSSHVARVVSDVYTSLDDAVKFNTAVLITVAESCTAVFENH